LTAGRAIARGKRGGKINGGPFAFPDMHERADHRADLVLQKRAGRGGDADFLAGARDIEAIERLHRRLGLALGGAERREVVAADKLLRRRVHGLGIQRPRHPPGAILLKRKIRPPVDDTITVMTFDRREARVEIQRRALHGEHRDRLRPQMEIDGVAHGLGVPVLAKIDMRDLAKRMHAGIGPSGGADDGLFARERGNRGGENALDRGAVILRLPPNKGRAIIFDRELVAGHR